MNEKLLEITLGTALREQAAKRGNKEFLVFPNQNIRYTFGDVDEKTDALAKGLLAAGFKKGDHIGIWAYSVPDWAPVFYAAARLGIVTVPINANCKHKELGFVLGQADINGLFIVDHYRDADFAEILYELIPELKNAERGSLKSAAFPCLRMVANIDKTTHGGMYVLDDLIALGNQIDTAELKKAEAQVKNTDVLCIMYTSGTTGIPKGAMLTHRSVINNGYLSIYSANKQGIIDENSAILNPLPFFYITALAGVFIEPLIYGFKIVVLENFDIIRCLEIIQNEACTWIFGVPTMYIALLSHPQFGSFNIESLQYGCIGGTVCPTALMKNIMDKMHIKVLWIGYGLTETSAFVTQDLIGDQADSRLTTVGEALPGVEVCIRDSITNAACPVDVQGEICVRGFNVMQGYYKMEKATQEAIDKDGWFHTGDLGHLLPNGYLVIDGRIKELIIRGGENIYPKEVENLLLSISGVQDAQVVGIPSKKYGEEVGAFILLKQGVRISEKEVIDFCKEKISGYKTPKYVFFVDAFPLSGNGKVQKFKLSESGFNTIQEKGIAT
jgi:fatty-acyl-CoA synthase